MKKEIRMKKDRTKKFEYFSAHSKIRIGKLIKDVTSSIQYSASLDLTGDIIMEKYASISHHVKVFTHKHKWDHSRGRRNKIQKIIPVTLTIGEDAFIGVGSIILGVTSIGKGAIVGAGSVLTKDVPEYEIWAGNPAKKIGERKG